jgi:hypothetical protein
MLGTFASPTIEPKLFLLWDSPSIDFIKDYLSIAITEKTCRAAKGFSNLFDVACSKLIALGDVTGVAVDSLTMSAS